MHTFKTRETIFNYNSDLSGDVQISGAIKIKSPRETGADHVYVKVDGQALLMFIASVVRDMKISKLEQATFEEIFDL